MRKLAYLVICLAALVLIWVWFRDKTPIGAGESGIPFFNMGWHSQATHDSWKVSTLGNMTGITTAAYPTYSTLAQAENAGVPTYLIQAAILFLAFSLSGIAIFLLIREIYPDTHTIAGLMGVFFYWFNPFSLVNVWNRFENNAMVFFAYLPWAAFLFIRGTRRKKIEYALLVSLVSVVFSFALTSVPFDILIWILFTLVTAHYVLLANSMRDRLFYLGFFGLSLVSFISINFWWVSQLVGTSAQSSLAPTITKYFSPVSNLTTLSALSQRLGNLSDVFLLNHGIFSSDSQVPWRILLGRSYIKGIEFIIMAVVLWVITRLKRNKEVLLMAVIFFVGMFIAKGNNPPFGGMFELAFSKLPVLQVFRNPFEKGGLLIALPASVLFAISIHSVSRVRLLKSIVVGLICAFVILVWGYPFWTGLVFSGINSSDNHLARSYKVAVPDYYHLVDNWFQSQSGLFRFLVLPIGNEGITYDWQNNYSGIELSSSIFRTPNISFNTSIPFYSELVDQISINQLHKSLLDFMPFISGKYLVWRGDINNKDRRMVDPAVTQNTLEQWVADGSLIKKFTAGKLAVYEISQKLLWPKVFRTQNIIVSNEPDLSSISSLFNSFPQQKIAIVPPEYVSPQLVSSAKNWIIRPTLAFQLPSSSKLSTNSEEKIVTKLPFVSHLPGDTIYPLSRLKELLLAPPKSDVLGWSIHQVGILGKRAVEIYKLRKIHAPDQVVAEAEATYLSQLAKFQVVLPTVMQTYKVLPDVMIDSFLSQNIILARVDSPASESLSKLFPEMRIRSIYDLPVASDRRYIIYELDIPMTSDYALVSSTNFSQSAWFLDGQQIEIASTGEDLKIHLTKGSHELALSLPADNQNTAILTIPTLEASDLKPVKLEVDGTSDSTTYKISFDFRFRQGRIFNLKFVQDIDRPDNPIYFTQVYKDDNFHDWRHWDGVLTSSVGKGQTSLEIFAPTERACDVVSWKKTLCFDKKVGFDVELRDVSISQVDTPGLYFTIRQDLSSEPESPVTWERVNPATYKLKFTKSSTEPEMIIFSELFNPAWQISATNGTKFPATHYRVNDFANGWWLNEPGEYELKLQFAPQTILEIGKKLSIISFILASVGFLFMKLRKRK